MHANTSLNYRCQRRTSHLSMFCIFCWDKDESPSFTIKVKRKHFIGLTFHCCLTHSPFPNWDTLSAGRAPVTWPSPSPARRYCMTLPWVLMDTLPFGNSPAATNTTRRATPAASTQDSITAQERMNYHRSFDVVGKLTTGCVTAARAVSCFTLVSKFYWKSMGDLL